MSRTKQPHTVRLSGEVVEIFEKDGQSIARVVLKPGCIEVPLDSLREYHLGDQVLIDMEITVHRVEHHDAGSAMTPTS